METPKPSIKHGTGSMGRWRTQTLERLDPALSRSVYPLTGTALPIHGPILAQRGFVLTRLRGSIIRYVLRDRLFLLA
jgi:hypothetical protein